MPLAAVACAIAVLLAGLLTAGRGAGLLLCMSHTFRMMWHGIRGAFDRLFTPTVKAIFSLQVPMIISLRRSGFWPYSNGKRSQGVPHAADTQCLS